MSYRIGEILEVVEKVRRSFSNSIGGSSVSDLRIAAVKSVAEGRQIDPTTVSDKYRRQLKPGIRDTKAFDVHLEDWLRSGSPKLRDILVTQNPAERERIDSVFGVSG